jgi:hypothetical protein
LWIEHRRGGDAVPINRGQSTRQSTRNGVIGAMQHDDPLQHVALGPRGPDASNADAAVARHGTTALGIFL